MNYEVKTQAELRAALKKAKPNDWITCIGKGRFEISDSASVTASGSASVTAYDSASVTASGSASVRASGSASVRASGSASVTAYGSASVTAYGSASVTASQYVAVHKLSRGSKIKGGVVIEPPSLKAPEAWCEFYGITAKRGRVVVFKAVDQDFQSGYGWNYTPGTKPKAEDFKPTNACGNGLHFGPSPHHSERYFNGPKPRYVAVSVKLSDLVSITDEDGHSDKAKAPEGRVLYEVDVHGDKVAAK